MSPIFVAARRGAPLAALLLGTVVACGGETEPSSSTTSRVAAPPASDPTTPTRDNGSAGVVPGDGGGAAAVAPPPPAWADPDADSGSVAPVPVAPVPVALVRGAPAECDGAPTAEVAYENEGQLDGLIVGRWIRCEGTIQPIGSPPAPDGQDALGFDLFHKWIPDASLPPGGSVMAVLAADAFDAGASEVLVYTGGGYSSYARWSFATDDAGQPAIGFWLTPSQQAPILDRAVFSDNGNKLQLFDSLWHGTYVRVRQ